MLTVRKDSGGNRIICTHVYPQYEPRDCRFVWCPEERFGISQRIMACSGTHVRSKLHTSYRGGDRSCQTERRPVPYGLMFRCSTRFGHVDVKAASVPSPDDCATTSKRVRHHRVVSSPYGRLKASGGTCDRRQSGDRSRNRRSAG
jgi:hypothetical protein